MDLIQLTQGNTSIVLHGAGAAAPFRGALLRAETPSSSAEQNCQVDVQMEGTVSQIEAGLGSLSALLDDAERWAKNPGAAWVYLEARAAPGGDVWRSKVAAGRVELLGAGPGQRAGGSQGARLHLVRENWWDGAQREVYTSAVSDGRSTIGKAVTNTPGQNWLHVAAADIAGDLPAPALLRLAAYNVGPTGGDVLVAENVFSSPESLPVYYQGEAGVEVWGTLQADHAAISFPGVDPLGVWSVDIAGADIRKMAGRPMRVMMRLKNPAGGGPVWQRWDIRHWYNGSWNMIWSSEMSYIAGHGAGGNLSLGPVIHFPPWYVDADTAWAESLRFRLAGHGDLNNTHTLDLDYIGLLPLDGWRQYTHLLPANDIKIVDDPLRGVIYPGGEGMMQTHTAEGPGLFLYPGRPARFYFHTAGSGAAGYAPAQVTVVSLAYRPRKRVL